MNTSRCKYVFLSIILLQLLTFTALADDYHYINNHIGDRATGLGGAYTAISDDPSGCYYNPAGIAFSMSTSLSASVNAYNRSTKTYKNALLGVDGGYQNWVQESSSLLPNFFGIVRKLDFGTIGLSYAVPNSINRRQKQSFNDIQSSIAGNNIQSYTININDSDTTYYFGPSYAYKVSDTFSVGTTMYIYYRDMEIIRTQLLRFEQGEHYFVNYYESKTDWGYKPSIGAVWEPFDKLALGLTLSKIFISSSDNSEQYIIRDTTPGGSGIDFSDTDTIYFNYSENSEEDEFPFTVTLGAAYFASPRLLFSGDFSYYDTAGYKNSIYNISLGIEYYFSENYAITAGIFSDHANTSSISSSAVNQREHIDIYGLNMSLSMFHRTSSVTIGASYGQGAGEAQIISNSSAVQDVEINNYTVFLSASYSY